jgi:DNA-binding NarL/FixJ family response regulator
VAILTLGAPEHLRRTVELFGKLSATNRVQLAIAAFRAGIAE